MSEQTTEQLETTQTLDVEATETAENANRVAPSTKEVIAYLAEKFPLCFSVSGEAKALKIGIFQDVAEALAGDEKVSKTNLRHAIRAYTNSWRYLHACQPNAVRVGLQGEEAGVVDEAQAQHAAEALAASKAVVAERKAQERKEQRKAFFKQKAREENKKRPARKPAPQGEAAGKASAESLAALENRFGKGRK